MSCAAIREHFSLLWEGDLEETRRVRVEAHLERCADCRAAWEEFRAALTELRSAPRHPVARSFAEGVLAAADQRAGVRARAPWPWRRVAALVLFGLVGVLVGAEFVRLERRLASREDGAPRGGGAGDPVASPNPPSAVAELEARLRRMEETAERRERELAGWQARWRERQEQSLQQGVALAESFERLRAELATSRSLEPSPGVDPEGLRASDPGFAGRERNPAGVPDPAGLAVDPAGLAVDPTGLAVDPTAGPVDGATAAAAGSPAAVAASDGSPPWLARARREELEEPGCRVREVDGRLQLLLTPGHPAVEGELFELYDHGSPSERVLALDELDRRFGGASRASDEAAGGAGDGAGAQVLGFFQEVTGNRAEPVDPQAQERARVQRYRALWQDRRTP